MATSAVPSLRTLFPFMILISLAAKDAARAEEPLGEEPEKVRCPAFEVENTRESEDPERPLGPVQLVVVGIAKPCEGAEKAQRTCEITIEKTLFGSCAGTTVKAARCFSREGKRCIFELVPNPYSQDFVVRAQIDPEEEEAVTLLYSATLDFAVLSSESIFIGHVLTADEEFGLTVRVTRALEGPPIPPDTVVKVSSWIYMRQAGERPLVRPEPTIFFIGNIHQDRITQEKTYRLMTTLPLDLEKTVAASLLRQANYPVVEAEDDGEKVRFREIGFRGTPAEAIRMLGSEVNGAVSLVARSLVQSGVSARPDIVAAIETDLTAFERRKYGRYRRLRNLIRVLGTVERTTPSGSIQRLVTRLLDSAMETPPVMPDDNHDGERREKMEEDESVNHGLTWLLTQLPQETVASRYAERLLNQRDAAVGGWKSELQLALDACHVEDDLELASALARARDFQPTRSPSRPRFAKQGVKTVRFSQSGKLLGVADLDGSIRILRTSDWSIVGALGEELGGNLFEFGADESQLYIARRSRVDLLEWRSGTILRKLRFPGITATGMSLSREDKTLLVVDFYERIVRAWDVKAGVCLRTWDCPDRCWKAALSPDGNQVAVQTSRYEITVEEVQENKRHRVFIPHGEDLESMHFTPESGYLITTTLAWKASGRTLTVRVLHAKTDFNQVAEASFPATTAEVVTTMSGTGKWFALATGSTSWVLPLPSLAPAKEINHPEGRDICSLDFAPDGRLLAAGDRSTFPILLRLPDCVPLLPFEGHRNPARAVYFDAEGTSLVSVGRDQEVLRWELSTMKLVSRQPIPDGWVAIGIREPDAKYALCFTTTAVEKSSERFDPQVTNARVLDLESMKAVCDVELPIARFGTDVFWLDEHTAAVVADKAICTFDYLSGVILKKVTDAEDYPRGKQFAEDRTLVVAWTCSMRTGSATLQQLDLATGSVGKLGSVNLNRLTGNSSGVAPGGRFFLANPGMYVFDLKTLQSVSQREYRDLPIQAIAFDSDGERYALAMGGRYIVENNESRIDPGAKGTIRIHETTTGKLLLAFPAWSDWVSTMTFSPDGSHLAVVNRDATIEVRPLR